MEKILRDPARAAGETYDLIIIGGGIYGVMLSLESSRRGLRSLLIERDDFGSVTSFNSLRTLHGGFRYLQNLDLHRFRESVNERRWFLQNFPGLVRPLPCLMPLYGDGLRRPFVLRIALWANDFLSHKRNRGVRPDRYLPAGKLISADQTREIFPKADVRGLSGGAVWYDAYMPDSQRLLIEVLRWSCKYGGSALNYVEASKLLKNKESATGILTVDRESGEFHEYRANVIVNAAGPWCRKLAACFDRDEPNLFRSSIAWNVLLNRQPLSNHAVAVTPKKPGGRTYFLLPWKGKLLAGTGHAPWFGNTEKPMPSTELLQEFLDHLNLATPKLEVRQDDIIHVFAGLIPTTKEGDAALADCEVILNHADHGGPRGFYSISGVKFTTARLVAEKTLNRIYPEKKVAKLGNTKDFSPPEDVQSERGIFDFRWRPAAEESKWKAVLHSLIREEAVQHLDDLIFRRTTLWDNSSRALEIAPLICELFDWDSDRCSEEIERLTKNLGDGKIQNKG